MKRLVIIIILIFLTNIQGENITENYIKDILKYLSHKNYYIRKFTRKQLILIGNPCIKILKENFNKLPYKARREIVIIISKIEKEKALDFLISCLYDRDYGVRNRASLEILEYCDYFSPYFSKIKKLTSKDKKIQYSINILKRNIIYKRVEYELFKLISPQGGFGFYEGQFKNLEKLKKDALMPLLNIFIDNNYIFINRQYGEDEEISYKIRYLAGEGICELSQAINISKSMKSAIINKLKSLTYSNKIEEQLKEIALTTLYFLGYKKPLQKMINRLKFELYFREDSEIYSRLGLIYLRIKKEKEALKLLHKAIKVSPQNSLAYYNLACAYSCLGRINEALDALEKAIYNGYEDLEWIKKDGDLNNIRNTPRFKKLIKILKKRLKK